MHCRPKADCLKAAHLRHSDMIGASRVWPDAVRLPPVRLAVKADRILQIQQGQRCLSER